MWGVTGDEKIIDVIEGTEREGLSTCVREDETNEERHASSWSEGINQETDELLVESVGGRNKFDGAGLNGFANGRVK